MTPRGFSAARWNIAAGNFFFHYRNAIFPSVIAVTVLLFRPQIILGDPGLDRLLVLCGAAIALAGEAIRLTTIGFEYIERGGKQGKVYASKLVQGGVYALTRNPMYVGNALIAIGIAMVTGTRGAYLVLIPLFLFIYQAIVSAEEAYLRPRFGRDYDEYCAKVNRFLPSLGRAPEAFAGMRYNWKRAVLQDLSTIIGLSFGLALLPFWRLIFLQGFDAAKQAVPLALLQSAVILAVYGVLHRMKKRGQLH